MEEPWQWDLIYVESRHEMALTQIRVTIRTLQVKLYK